MSIRQRGLGAGAPHERREAPAGLHELPPGAELRDAAIVQQQDPRVVPDRAEAVRDGEAGPAAEGGLQRGVGRVVHGARGLVEAEDPRVPGEGPRRAEQLPLAEGPWGKFFLRLLIKIDLGFLVRIQYQVTLTL